MKVQKILQNLFLRQSKDIKKTIPPCPVVYDKNNVTEAEFKKYINWLAGNNINKTFREPDRFVTSAERKALEKKNLEFREFVEYLAENNINRTFIC